MLARLPLRAGVTFGAERSRGDRARQEDALSVACVSLPCEELRKDLVRHAPRGATRDPWFGWSCEQAGGADLGSQVVWFGVFDGHGGSAVSSLLADKLHCVFEHAHPDMIADTGTPADSHSTLYVLAGRLLFALQRWRARALGRPAAARASPHAHIPFFAHERGAEYETTAPRALSGARRRRRGACNIHHPRASPCTHVPGRHDDGGACHTGVPYGTFRHSQQMDREVHQNEVYQGAGSTASVLLVHSLDLPAVPWFESEYLSMTTIQLGDTRFLLCSAEDGRAVPLTTLHHPDDRGEAERLSRLGAGIVTDSFGERRFLGTLANTRAFGDAQAKRYGVTSEPEVRTLVLRGAQFAFAIGVSDGISDVMSDQEMVDECRAARHPQEAAQRVLRYAEDLGSDDNATVVVVPLRGWGRIGGPDRTHAKRAARRNNTDIYRIRRQ